MVKRLGPRGKKKTPSASSFDGRDPRKHYPDKLPREKKHPILAMKEFFERFSKRKNAQAYAEGLRDYMDGPDFERTLEALERNMKRMRNSETRKEEIAETVNADETTSTRRAARLIRTVPERAYADFRSQFYSLVDYYLLLEDKYYSQHPDKFEEKRQEYASKMEKHKEENTPILKRSMKLQKNIRESRLKRTSFGEHVDSLSAIMMTDYNEIILGGFANLTVSRKNAGLVIANSFNTYTKEILIPRIEKLRAMKQSGK